MYIYDIEFKNKGLFDISVDTWEDLLNNDEIINDEMKSILFSMYSFIDHSATVKELEKLINIKYHRISMILGICAKKVKEFLQIEDDILYKGRTIYYPLMFIGYQTNRGFLFEIRKNLRIALEHFNPDLKVKYLHSKNFDEIILTDDIDENYNLLTSIQEIVDKYPNEKSLDFGNTPLITSINENLIKNIQKFIDSYTFSDILIPKLHVGKSDWIDNPWIEISNKKQSHKRFTYSHMFYISLNINLENNNPYLSLNITLNNDAINFNGKESYDFLNELYTYFNFIPEDFINIKDGNLANNVLLSKRYDINFLTENFLEKELKEILMLFEHILPFYNILIRKYLKYNLSKNVVSDFRELWDVYPTITNEAVKDNLFAKKMRKNFAENLQSLVDVISNSKYHVKVSHGRADWIKRPWAGIRIQKAAKSFGDGLYIMYQFDFDKNYIDLSINQGYDNYNGKKRDILINRANNLSEKVQIEHDFKIDIDESMETTETAVLYKYMDIHDISNNDFADDLEFIMEEYEKIIPEYDKMIKESDFVAENNFEWTSFYMEFADKLLEYSNNRQELIPKIIKLWNNIDMDMPLLEKDNNIVDMDPFTIFGLFNKNFTVNNRISILKYMKEEFNIKSKVPTNFDGIPRLNPQSATFYHFKDKRNEDDINNLWNVFESAIDYVKTNNSQRFIESYDKALNQLGIKWNITMALYWIRPYDFISLDKNNREFLSQSSNINKDLSEEIKSLKNPPHAEKYLQICKNCKEIITKGDYPFNTFPELSNYAYIQSQENEDNVKNENNGIGDSEDHNEVNYWLYAPGQGAKKWDKYSQNSLMGIGWSNVGDLTQYSDRKEIVKKFQTINQSNSKYSNDSLALWQFANEIKVGDIIFAKKGMHEILGYGIVESEYFYDETLDLEHYHMLKVNWKEKGHYPYDGTLAMKTLTKITDYPELVNKINDYFESSPEELEVEPEYPEYTVDDFLDEVFMTEDDYKTLSNLLKYKKNIILQGAPGVGKTFIAKRLAYSLLGCKDKSKVSMVQFHQSYSYEDFILGYRPNADGFDLREGIFYNFCKIASEDEDNDYYFIIDEINRGNLSKIFGELFMLLENDKRGSRNKIHLLYKDELFYIPENVYIIGMMNTADRSLALLDYALRRRFAFYNLEPGFDSDKFMEYVENLDNQRFTNLINIIKQLNNDISMDESLGKGFVIGHSYFSNLKKDNVDKKLNYIIEYEIIPLLEEYWFDEEDKVINWSYRLRSVIL